MFSIFFILIRQYNHSNFPLYLLKHRLLFLKLSYFSFKPHLSSCSSFQFLPILFFLLKNIYSFVNRLIYYFSDSHNSEQEKNGRFQAAISASQKVTCLICRQTCRCFTGSVCRKQDHKSYKYCLLQIYIFIWRDQTTKRLSFFFP